MPFTACAFGGVWLGLGVVSWPLGADWLGRFGSASWFGGALIGLAVLLTVAGLRGVQNSWGEWKAGGERNARGARSPGRRWSVSWVMCSAALFMGSVGLGICQQHVAHPPEVVAAAQEGMAVSVTGTISSRPAARVTPWGSVTCSADVRLAKNPSSGNARRSAVSISVLDLPCDALAGQHVEVTGRLRETEVRRQIVATMIPIDMAVTGNGSASERVVRSIDVSLSGLLADLPHHARGLVPGVALGDDARVDQKLADAMQITGLTHLIAVSGGHISILTAIVVAVVGRRSNVVTALLSALALVALVLLVGPHASVIRAVAMSAVVLTAMAGGRGTGAVPALCLAMIGTAWLFPWIAMGYGFWLSAAATGGIVVLGTPLAEHMARSIPTLLAEAIAVPLAAQLSCIPVLMLFSEEGSIWAVAANAAVAPVVAPLTVTGLVAAVAAPVLPVLATLALLPATMATWWIDVVARALASAPGSGISLIWAGIATLILLAAALAIRYYLIVAVSLGVLVAAVMWAERPAGLLAPPDEWVLIQCDVGQGSGLIARQGDRTMMIDVGPEGPDAAKCLKNAQVKRLDLLVLSHAHSDHIGGLPEVLDAVDVTEVWLSPNPDPAPNTQWVEAQLTDRGVPFRSVQAGYSFEGEQLDVPFVEVLWPTVPNQREGEANAQSLAVRIDVAGGVLVLSDLPAISQERMVPHVDPVPILIMAHHGSRDQSARLAEVAQPGLVLVSVGENTYGHPAPEALQIYGNPQILDTRTCGAIAVERTGAIASRCE